MLLERTSEMSRQPQLSFIFISTLSLLVGAAVGQSDTSYRLSTPIVPSAYTLLITPYFNTSDSKSFTFNGEVDIHFKTVTAIKQIKLHSEDLTFTAADIEVTDGINSNAIELNETTPLSFDSKYKFAYINLKTDLQVEYPYLLRIVYTGPIRTDLVGFYRNHYVEGGVKKWLGATQMEPTHARKVFPSFDEPELKAVFTLTIDRPQNFQPTLANTKMQGSTVLENGYVRETFYPTPKMSTYLVAFLISELQGVTNNNETNEFGVYTRPDALYQASYAFDFGQRVAKALGEYFNIDYYGADVYLKLDHVALPDFRAGAMENWGLIDYRESLLLLDSKESNPYYKYRVAQIIAHETTHMWFGNLVTCYWWSNTWLNEGFANYFQDYMTSIIEPEVESGDILVTGSVYSAFEADSTVDSAPINNPNVNSPEEISAHFGTISYQKAGSIIRMIHHLIGDNAFKVGLNYYLNNNRLQSGTPELMYEALQYGVTTTNGTDISIASVMGSWMNQAGHPILHVTVKYNTSTVSLQQKRYYANSSVESNEIYKIPITYATETSIDFENTSPNIIMETKEMTLSIPNINQGHPWIIFNKQDTGFYRVNYDDHSWQIINEVLNSANRTKIHYLNRAKIVNDLFAFFYSDIANFGQLFNTLDFLKSETDYSVWLAAIRGVNKLRSMYLGTNLVKHIDTYTLNLMDNIVKSLGYEVGSSDSYITLRNRMQIMEFACKIGHEGCITASVERFNNFMANATIDPSLRPVTYCSALKSGGEEQFQVLWKRMLESNVANEVLVIQNALGCSLHEESIKSYLTSMQGEDSPIRTQDLTVPLSSVLSNYEHLPLVLSEFKNNFALWNEIYSPIDTVFTTIASVLRTDSDFDEFENLVDGCSECSAETKANAMKAMVVPRARSAWAKSHQSYIEGFLYNFALNATPSLILLVCGIAAVIGRI